MAVGGPPRFTIRREGAWRGLDAAARLGIRLSVHSLTGEPYRYVHAGGLTGKGLPVRLPADKSL
jgi:hypothetical protein